MTELEIARWVVYAVMGLAIWFLKRTVDGYDDKFKTIESNRTEQSKEIAEIRRDYLHRDDFREFKNELRGMFEELKVDIKELKHKNEKN
jgi:hypothetical protein